MKHSEKYSHVGYSHPGVSKHWVPSVEKAIEEIEKVMWPRWIPMWLKRKIHYLAMGHSVVYVKNLFWYKVRNYLTDGQIIIDIKSKYAELRIYGHFGEKIDLIVDRVSDECDNICEKCGSREETKKVGRWVYNLCKDCRNKKKSSK